MTAYYEIVDLGSPPLLLEGEVKPYLKLITDADDSYIDSLIIAATQFGEAYTGRVFKADTWRVLLDDFHSRIQLWRTTVDTITHVKYTVSNVLTTVDASIYYLKKTPSYPEILLTDGKSWPTNGDKVEQGIEIQFVCKAPDQMDLIKRALLSHVAYLYRNRGDCDMMEALKKSGADQLYDLVSIPKV